MVLGAENQVTENFGSVLVLAKKKLVPKISAKQKIKSDLYPPKFFIHRVESNFKIPKLPSVNDRQTLSTKYHCANCHIINIRDFGDLII